MDELSFCLCRSLVSPLRSVINAASHVTSDLLTQTAGTATTPLPPSLREPPSPSYWPQVRCALVRAHRCVFSFWIHWPQLAPCYWSTPKKLELINDQLWTRRWKKTKNKSLCIKNKKGNQVTRCVVVAAVSMQVGGVVLFTISFLREHWFVWSGCCRYKEILIYLGFFFFPFRTCSFSVWTASGSVFLIRTSNRQTDAHTAGIRPATSLSHHKSL